MFKINPCNQELGDFIECVFNFTMISKSDQKKTREGTKKIDFEQNLGPTSLQLAAIIQACFGANRSAILGP